MKKRRSRPISRILSTFALQASRPVALRRDDHSSRPGIARGLQRPTRQPRTGRPFAMRLSLAGRPHRGAALFGLAPCGVLPATAVTGGAVRSYRTISPLPFGSPLRARSRAVSFLCHCSVRLLCPGVTRRTALRSSDFPPASALRASAPQARRPAHRHPGAKAGDRLADCDAFDYRAAGCRPTA
jgi:hypothetical protein